MSHQTPGSSAPSERAASSPVRLIFRRIGYAVLVLEIAALLGLFGCNSCQRRTTARQGYGCINQTCTVAATFFGGTPAGDPILGFQTSVYLPAASGLSGGTATNLSGQVSGGFLKNSVALNAGPSAAFVEAGYVIQGGVNFDECGQGGNFYFLAEYANGALAVRCLAQIPPEDFGNWVNVQILNVFNSGQAPTFLVNIANRGTNLQPCPEASPCVEPLWNPGGTNFASAALGQTLVGTNGAFADGALFANNSYQNAPGPDHLNFEKVDGTASFDNPPLGSWIAWPSQPVAANGGAFHTFCCQITTLFPGVLNFGNLPLHSTSGSQAVTITNTSTSVMNISGITISGAKSSDFTKNSTGCGGTLAPQATCDITISFTPSVAGREDATLTVTGSGGGSESATVTLFGYGH